MVQLVFKMSATEVVSVGIELISLALAEECRKILEKGKKRRRRQWWVKPWIRRREQLGASTQLLVEIPIATGII
jgi:predicted nucleic acid-binding Zn ribbon protein